MKNLATSILIPLLFLVLSVNCTDLEDDIDGRWESYYSDNESVSVEFRFYSRLGKGEEFTYFNDESNSLNCQLKFDFTINDGDSESQTLSRTFASQNFCIDFYSKEVELQPADTVEEVSIKINDDGNLVIGGTEFSRPED